MAEQLENLWKRASIPCVTSARIIALIKSFHDKVANISKSMKTRTNCVKFQSKQKAFIEDARSKLFDYEHSDSDYEQRKDLHSLLSL